MFRKHEIILHMNIYSEKIVFSQPSCKLQQLFSMTSKKLSFFEVIKSWHPVDNLSICLTLLRIGS